MFFILILVQKLLCYFSEISRGTMCLPNSSLTKEKKLSIKKVFWYETVGLPCIVFFKRNQVENNEICSLILALPFRNDQLRNDQINVKPDVFRAELKKIFTLNYSAFFELFWLLKITYEEDEYLSFHVAKDLEIALKFCQNEFYSYSNFDFLEFAASRVLFDEIDYGIKIFNHIMMFNDIFLLIESDIGFIVYRDSVHRDKENPKLTTRNFFAKSRIIWANAVVEQNGITLKIKPILEIDKIIWTKTENNRDEFAIQLGPKKVAFSFGFDGQALTKPRIQVDEIESFRILPNLNRLSLVNMNVLELTLNALEVIHVITPKFVFVEDLDATHILFFVYYDMRCEVEGRQRVDYSYAPVFYPFSKTEVSFKIKIGRTDPFRILFKKTVANGELFFKKEVDIQILGNREYEIPLFSNSTNSELDYVYTYLKQFHWNINGMLGKVEENKDQSVITSYPKDTYFLDKTNNVIFVVFLVLFCLGLSLLVLFLFKKMHLKKKKLKVRKKHK